MLFKEIEHQLNYCVLKQRQDLMVKEEVLALHFVQTSPHESDNVSTRSSGICISGNHASSDCDPES